MLRSTRASRALLVLSALAIVGAAHSQSLHAESTAAYGTGPNAIVGYQPQSADYDPSGGIRPIYTDSQAIANLNSDEGFRDHEARVMTSSDFGYFTASHRYGVSNAYYTYLNGSSSQRMTDRVTFANAAGLAGAGKFRMVVDFTKSGGPGSASVTAPGFSASNLTTTRSLVSEEMDFEYGNAFTTYLDFATQSEFFTSAFDYRDGGSDFGASIRFLITDAGGVDPSGIYSFSDSSTSYGVQAVPEPASMAALAVGAVGLLRRRVRRSCASLAWASRATIGA